MSDEQERYVDPSSGAASQPGSAVKLTSEDQPVPAAYDDDANLTDPPSFQAAKALNAEEEQVPDDDLKSLTPEDQQDAGQEQPEPEPESEEEAEIREKAEAEAKDTAEGEPEQLAQARGAGPDSDGADAGDGGTHDPNEDGDEDPNPDGEEVNVDTKESPKKKASRK